MVGQTAKGQIDKRIQIKICSTMFLHFKEEWIITIGTKLQETESSDNKEQNTITFNWRSYQQIKESEIL